jgi:hypothetical protein
VRKVATIRDLVGRAPVCISRSANFHRVNSDVASPAAASSPIVRAHPGACRLAMMGGIAIGHLHQAPIHASLRSPRIICCLAAPGLPGRLFLAHGVLRQHQRDLLRGQPFLALPAPEPRRPGEYACTLIAPASSPSSGAFAAHARNTLTRPSHALVLRVSNLGSLGSSGCSVMVLGILGAGTGMRPHHRRLEAHGLYLAGSAAPSRSIA